MTADARCDRLDDLDAVEVLRSTGQIDEDTADRLWLRYARAAVDREDTDDAVDDGSPQRSGSRAVVAAGVGALIAVLVAVVAIGPSLAQRGQGELVTGNEATGGRDLSSVTDEEMEQVLAANPDIVPMRLRLAHRYLDGGELDRAVEHYLEVLDRTESPEALSHLGWVLFSQGRADLAEPFLERGLELAPEDTEALWFRANQLVYASDAPGDAVPLIERLLGRSAELGEAQADDVRALLDEALRRQASS